jgi:hypothetical protein
VLADGALGGEVHDSAGAGIAGIELKLYGPWWDGAVETILSDERGRFQFTHVGAHDYRVRCFDPSRVHATVESGPWSIAEGERRIDLAITLPPAASIAVSITHGVGVPAPDGTPVYLFVEGQEQVAQRAQTRDGSCVLDRLLGGSYTVAAGGIGGHYGEMYRSMNPVFADLRLDPGERREIRLDLPRN